MSINISAFAGAGAQFFDANGAPLTGGLLYVYAAGTTTPVTSFTSRLATSNNTNPIVLNAAGRTPDEIWLTGGALYKFVLKSSTGVQIGSYDNIPAINDVTSVNTLITVAGTNTLTGLATPALVGYVAGAQYSFIAQNTNTAAVTIDIDTLGAKSISKAGSVSLGAGDIVAGAAYIILYDGTQFQLMTRTSASQLVIGTTAQRPSPATTGMIRQNSTTGNPEWYDVLNSQWLQFSQASGYSLNYLVVAGGGGGGFNAGGGGGAGGLISSTATANTGVVYTITVGAGGAGSLSQSAPGTSGSNSLAFSTTPVGGGGGGSALSSFNGVSGGSGGGAVHTGTIGAGTSGQGFAGGTGSGASGGGGGGGANAVGSNAVTTGGNGGAGVANSITGSSVNYAGGGGGGYNGGSGGTGGAGGGGAGSGSGAGFSGTANTGGGGGGASYGSSTAGGTGGSGLVVISYTNPTQRGTGGTVTSYVSGASTVWVHSFTSSGTYTA